MFSSCAKCSLFCLGKFAAAITVRSCFPLLIWVNLSLYVAGATEFLLIAKNQTAPLSQYPQLFTEESENSLSFILDHPYPVPFSFVVLTLYVIFLRRRQRLFTVTT